MSRRVVVVGAGLAGLSAACHLVGRGCDVVVVDGRPGPGGRTGTLSLGDFRFDTGPSVLTMPHLVRRCFDAVGADMERYLTLKPVDPMYRACFADGSEIRVRHGREAMAAEIEAACGRGEVDGFIRFCAWLTELYELEMGNFIERNWNSPLDLLRPFDAALRLLRVGGLRRLDTKVRQFFADERLVRLFSFQSLYAGVAPHQALALYSVITYMDAVNGVVAPEGGMYALPSALAAALTDAGVEFRYGEAVDQIITRSGTRHAVTGIQLESGDTLHADAVVCTVEVPAAYRSLLTGVSEPRRVRRARPSPSAVVWHLGVRGPLPAGVAHHNIHFGRAWGSSFEALLNDGRRMPDPSILVTVPTVDEPSMAPPGKHVLYVLEPVPNLDSDIDWRRERSRARSDLHDRIARLGYPVDIEVEQFMDPTDWAAQGMVAGTPFALAHSFRQTGPFRPANVDARVPGLFFGGSTTVPGVGIPMVLISGMLAADRVGAYEGVAA